jgi:hypothetical protein
MTLLRNIASTGSSIHRAQGRAVFSSTSVLLAARGRRAALSPAGRCNSISTAVERRSYLLKHTKTLYKVPEALRAATSLAATPDSRMYTASSALFEALWDAGVTHCFVNLGSDHPSILEAMAKSKKEGYTNFPRIITCPNEVRNTK